jgi:REP element-mobilizing transposase RayT
MIKDYLLYLGSIPLAAMKIEFHHLFTHIIFVTKNREPVIDEVSRPRIEKYITGIINNYDSKLYAIYANPDHVHMLISCSPTFSLERLASIIADSAERFINDNKLFDRKFRWQQSSAAFSVSKYNVDKICRYILRQPEHQRKGIFSEEYDSYMKFYQKTLHPDKE